MILEHIKEPSAVKNLNKEELTLLCDEIRNKITETVSFNGGHLASNLGVVELTVALHKAFHSPVDKLIFDVGHQVYTHKLLTGRFDDFATLRQYKGIAGFPKYCESEHDAFEVGHASTSISVALGMARARDLKKETHNIVAILGDGALTGGMCYEALNDAGNEGRKLIVILNDNQMSISKNVGALASYLSKLRASKSYREAKIQLRQNAKNIPIIGPIFYYFAHWFKTFFKKLFLKENFFSPLGFHYLGPIDGHNIEEMVDIFTKAQNYNGPVLIHCCTTKGAGNQNAEEMPTQMHGIAPKQAQATKAVSAGKVAAEKLLKMMENDPSIVVITAAMETGTSTSCIKQRFPDRYFDVGITEEHAVTMCAGMAKSGLKPYFFVYSTFFQRCYDQILHDVYLQNLPVVFCLDRCGISGEDGITHHGIYDLGMTNTLPGFDVYNAYSQQQLESLIQFSVKNQNPMVIRYGKALCNLDFIEFKPRTWPTLYNCNSYTYIVTYGSITSEVLKASALLRENNIQVNIIHASSIEPLDLDFLQFVSEQNAHIIVVEEHMVYNGLSSKLSFIKDKNNYAFTLAFIGIEDKNIQHGDRDCLLKDCKLDYLSIANKVSDLVAKYEK